MLYIYVEYVPRQFTSNRKIDNSKEVRKERMQSFAAENIKVTL